MLIKDIDRETQLPWGRPSRGSEPAHPIQAVVRRTSFSRCWRRAEGLQGPTPRALEGGVRPRKGLPSVQFGLVAEIRAGSRMKRQILKTILLALPKVLTYKARRFPAFRERLKQRNLAVRIELQDGSIGRTLEFRDGRIRSRTRDRTRPDVRMLFKDVATALKFLMPNPDQGEIIHAAKNFKVVTDGAGRARGLVRADHEHDPDRRPADGHAHARRQPPLHQLHQRRPPVRLRQGRPDPARDAASSSTAPTRRAGRSRPADGASARRTAPWWRPTP